MAISVQRDQSVRREIVEIVHDPPGPPVAAAASLEASKDAMTMARVKVAWVAGRPVHRVIGEVVTELTSLKLVGEGGIFERRPHVLLHTSGTSNPRPTLSSPISRPRTGGPRKNGSMSTKLACG